jgi:hypothetical protein
LITPQYESERDARAAAERYAGEHGTSRDRALVYDEFGWLTSDPPRQRSGGTVES